MALYLRIDKSKNPSQRITVQGSGRTAHSFRGNALTVRVAVFDEAGGVADLTGHASLNLSYMPVSRSAAAVATETTTIEDAVFTEAQWIAGTHYHAEFSFSETDMNPTIATGVSADYWLVLYGILTGGGDEITHGGSTITIEEDGTANTVTPPDPPAVGVTAAQVEVLLSEWAGLENVVGDTTPELGGPLVANGHQIREAKGADVPSATALAIGADGNYFSVTGTTTIASIAARGVGTRISLRFAGALTLTHHATDLILPTGANIAAAAGDVATFREYATGDWVCESYQRASGLALTAGAAGIGNVVEDTAPELGGPLVANGHQIREAKGADVPSATALAIGADGNYFSVTGTTTIESIAARGVGTRISLRFAGVLTLTHHATDLILLTGANITTAAGDVATFREYATGEWVCESYQRASGRALAEAPSLSTIWIPKHEMFPRETSFPSESTTESTTHKWTYTTFDFDQTSNEYVQFIRVMPSNWNLGTITAKFHWTASSGTGTARWVITSASIAPDATIDTATVHNAIVTDTLVATLRNHISDATPAHTVGGTPAAGSPVWFSVYRSPAGDTLNADARLIGVEITYGTL